MRLKQRPNNLLLLTAILLSIAGLFTINTTIDVHLFDTYFIFPLPLLIWTPTIILFIFWLLYLLTKHHLFSKKLTWVHMILTIVTSLFILTLPYITTYSYGGIAGMPRRYYDYGELNRYKILENLNEIAVPAFTVLIFGQLTYFINLVLGLCTRGGRQNNR